MSLDDSKKVTAIRTFAKDAARMKDAPKKDVLRLPLQTAEEVPTPVVPKTKKTFRKKAVPASPVEQPLIAPAEITAEVNKMAPEKAPSILAEETGIDVSAGSVSGTIIRDTKRKRFKLIPAMIQAVTEWFVGKKSAYETSHRPQQTIENADARKEIINAAVQEETLAPKEDFKTVAEKLKEAKRTPITSTMPLKDKAEVPKPQWSYVEDEKEPVPLETERPVPTSFESPVEEAARPISSVPETSVSSKEKTGEKSVITEPISYTSSTEEKEKSAEEIPAPALEEEPAPVVITPVQEKVSALEQVSYTPTITPAHAQRFPTYALMGVVLAATMLGIGASYYFFRETNAPQEKAIVYTIPSLIQATEQYPFLLQQDRETLLAGLRESLDSTSGVVQFYPTLQEGDTQKPASSEEILFVLAPRTSASFIRSVTQIAFGGVNAEPYIVMKVTSFDTAFAGMLDWEKTMSADLSPLFGQTVVETFDPSARTDTQVREAFFKDVIASNKNARVLLDEEGRERIIYTFIDQNTILMTTTKDALQTLVPLAR